MIDVMKHILIDVPCDLCSESYPISAELVRQSQEMLEAGCPGTSSYECAPLYYASLLPGPAVAHLVTALKEVEQGALRSGARCVRTDSASPPDPSRDVDFDTSRAWLGRWEDDGGAPSNPSGSV